MEIKSRVLVAPGTEVFFKLFSIRYRYQGEQSADIRRERERILDWGFVHKNGWDSTLVRLGIASLRSWAASIWATSIWDHYHTNGILWKFKRSRYGLFLSFRIMRRLLRRFGYGFNSRTELLILSPSKKIIKKQGDLNTVTLNKLERFSTYYVIWGQFTLYILFNHGGGVIHMMEVDCHHHHHRSCQRETSVLLISENFPPHNIYKWFFWLRVQELNCFAAVKK